MPEAICVKKCPYAYGSCEKGIIKFHPKHLHDDLLFTTEGYYLCHKGRLLTVNDRVCERCGSDLEINEKSSNIKILVYQCPTCKHTVKMDI